MPYRPISRDLKVAAIRLYEHGALELEDILECLGLSRRTWFRIRGFWRRYRDVVPPSKHKLGRPRLLDCDDIDYILRLVEFRPDWFLDELLDLLQKNRVISVHYTTIFRTLERCNISRKKLKIIASERDEDARLDFIRRMANYDPAQLRFIDETSKNEKTTTRRYGRSKRNRRAVRRAKFVRGRRVSAVACLTLDGIVSKRVVEGSLDRAMFCEWLEFSVVRSFAMIFVRFITPKLPSFPHAPLFLDQGVF
jgi:transposase